MMKLLSCRYNMDTNRVKARFADGSTVAIDCIAIEDEYGNTPAQRVNWTGCSTINHWSTPSLYWVVRLNIISRSAATMAD